MIQLRDYQEYAVNSTISALKEYRKVLLVLPTGSGKTVIGGAMAQRFLGKKTQKVVVMVHGDELIDQWSSSCYSMYGLRSGIIKSGRKPALRYRLQVASVQSAVRRKPIEDVGLIIVDECHRALASSYQKLMEMYPNAYIVGLTATPIRSDGQGFGDTFEKMIVGTTKAKLIKDGYLVPFKLFVTSLNPSMLKNVGMRGHDYDEKALGELMQDDTIMANAYKSWKEHADGVQTISFCSSVAHAKSITEMFQDEGVNAAMVCGETPAWERRNIVNQFRQGKITYLANMGVFTEGFDAKAIGSVQLLRATKSYSLYSQMIGRGMRPYEGKEHCILLDHGNNWIEHGLPNHEPRWSLEKNPEKDDTEVVMVKKENEEGEIEIIPAFRSELPNFADELEVLEADMTFRQELIDACFDYAEKKGHKRSSAYYNFSAGLRRNGDMPTIAELHYFRMEMGYDPYWVRAQARELGVKTL